MKKTEQHTVVTGGADVVVYCDDRAPNLVMKETVRRRLSFDDQTTIASTYASPRSHYHQCCYDVTSIDGKLHHN